VRRPLGRRKQRPKGIAALILAALAMSLLPPLTALRETAVAAAAASSARVGTSSQNTSITVSLARAQSVAPTGTMLLTVSVTLRSPVDTLSVRTRVRRPSGKLLYQKTQERYKVKAGTVQLQFSRPLSDLELKEGRYLVEVHVAADRLPPVTITDRLYVIRQDRRPVPVVVVARLAYTPMVAPDGRFVIDPATSTVARDDVSALAVVMGRSPWLRMSLGLPPLMLDEWRRMGSGYRLVTAEGEREVPKDAPVAGTYASALASLVRAMQDGRLEVLDVPFADPDLAGLQSMGSMSDLQRHYDRAFTAYRASLGATPSAGTAVAGDSVPDGALPILESERIGHILAVPSAVVVSKTATAAPGVYELAGTKVRAMVLDERAGALMAGERASSDELLDHLFATMTSTKGDVPVVVSVRIGPGGIDPRALESRLLDLAGTGWVRFETTAEAAGGKPLGRGRLRPVAHSGRPAPEGYWTAVTYARRYAQALVEAVSDRDDDAARALYDALLAESRLWAGPDGDWADAGRGRAFADAAAGASRRVLDSVTVATQTITLSGATGKVPLSVRNGSDKTLQVYIVAQALNTRFPAGRRIRVTLRPAENYVVVPVDLGAGGVFDQVHLAVVSGKVTLASTTVDVHASYLDRLALIATVVVVLGVLLFYIRRKVRTKDADT
jgi:hypothetical protein